MTDPNDDVPIECWWETATTTLNLDSDELDALGNEKPQRDASDIGEATMGDQSLVVSP
jgi:hypothetical protein